LQNDIAARYTNKKITGIIIIKKINRTVAVNNYNICKTTLLQYTNRKITGIIIIIIKKKD